MLIEILARTPTWVFPLFFALVVLGCMQARERTVSRGRVSILPMVMMVLSLSGVLSAFGPAPVGLGCWLLGVGIALGLGARLITTRGVAFSETTQSFFVPGSWWPLVFMMAIFFTKFTVGVILARQLPITGETAFVGAVSLWYGLFSGVFLARAMVLWRFARYHRQRRV